MEKVTILVDKNFEKPVNAFISRRKRTIRECNKDLKRNFNKYDRDIKKIPADKLVEIKVLTKKYEKAQKRIAEIFEEQKNTCKNCGECCCHEVRGYLNFIDYAIYKLEGHTVPKLKLNFKKDSDELTCGFLREDGCAFPRELRPRVCVSHVCSKLSRSIEEVGKNKKCKLLTTRLYNLYFKIERVVSHSIEDNNYEDDDDEDDDDE
jgi:Fe-S-cluster containining protein